MLTNLEYINIALHIVMESKRIEKTRTYEDGDVDDDTEFEHSTVDRNGNVTDEFVRWYINEHFSEEADLCEPVIEFFERMAQ